MCAFGDKKTVCMCNNTSPDVGYILTNTSSLYKIHLLNGVPYEKFGSYLQNQGHSFQILTNDHLSQIFLTVHLFLSRTGYAGVLLRRSDTWIVLDAVNKVNATRFESLKEYLFVSSLLNHGPFGDQVGHAGTCTPLLDGVLCTKKVWIREGQDHCKPHIHTQ